MKSSRLVVLAAVAGSSLVLAPLTPGSAAPSDRPWMNTSLTPAERATMLVQFLASNVLSGNKAVAMSRDRVISHLRQPEFEKKFIADIPDPSQHASALRDFHTLLRSAGLG